MNSGSMVGQDSSEGGARAEGCAICLEPISGESFLDQCFLLEGCRPSNSNSNKMVGGRPDMFCYHCILQWSEMALARPQSTSHRLQCLTCPLCKTPYTSIIHDLSGAKFQRHYFLTSAGNRYQRLESHIQRQAVYACKGEQAPSRFTNLVPKPNRWLTFWVQRELQALMQEEDVETVTQHVVGVVEAFSKRAGGQARVSAKHDTVTKGLDWHTTISTTVRPFIFELAEKFAEELGLFLVSGWDIATYDNHTQLRASVTGDLNLTKGSTSQVASKEFPSNKTYDLYDEDVDEEGVELMVGRRSIEADSHSSEETSEDMERPSHKKRNHGQDHRHSRREIIEDKHKKKPLKPSDYSHEDSAKGRSRHEGEVSKNRKRGRQSPSLPRNKPR